MAIKYASAYDLLSAETELPALDEEQRSYLKLFDVFCGFRYETDGKTVWVLDAPTDALIATYPLSDFLSACLEDAEVY